MVLNRQLLRKHVKAVSHEQKRLQLNTYTSSKASLELVVLVLSDENVTLFSC